MAATEEKTEGIFARLRAAMLPESCWTCDVLHGVLADLQLDAREDIESVTESMTFPADPTHGCLGCDPCPPADLHAEHVRRRRARKSKAAR